MYPLFQAFDGDLRPTLGPMTLGDNSLIYGFDSLTYNTELDMEPVLSPTNAVPNYYFDLMSYCQPIGTDDEDCWPSSVTYVALLQSLKKPNSANPALQGGGGTLAIGGRIPIWSLPKSPKPLGGGDDDLIVQGSVDFSTGIAHFLPCLPLDYDQHAAHGVARHQLLAPGARRHGRRPPDESVFVLRA